MNINVQDMPKLHSPFVRVEVGEDALVTPTIAPGLEWVFEDPDVVALEKLDGENVSVIIEGGEVKQLFSRATPIPIFNKGKAHVVHAVVAAYARGYMDHLPDGQHYGEAIGPVINGNHYKLSEHIWIPFSTYAREHLLYKSWGKYPKDFDTISSWFKEGLFSLYHARHGGEKIPAEGIAFHHPDGRMAKLRRDMYDWYDGPRHKRYKKRRR